MTIVVFSLFYQEIVNVWSQIKQIQCNIGVLEKVSSVEAYFHFGVALQ